MAKSLFGKPKERLLRQLVFSLASIAGLDMKALNFLVHKIMSVFR